MENLFWMVRKGNPDSNYSITLNMGDKKLAMISLEDLGNLAAKIFTDPTYIGKDVYFSGD
jgi:hypothetical protein